MSRRSLVVAVVVATVSHWSAPLRAQQFFLESLGFEDDVDLVVAPNGAFVVIPEESKTGSSARVRIVKLNPATGEPLAISLDQTVPGWEHGVDPLVKAMDSGNYLVALPVEYPGGSGAAVRLVLMSATGIFVDEQEITLGSLGFRQDVDGMWNTQCNSILCYALESTDRLTQGVLAIDVDDGDGDWGACHLLTNGTATTNCGATTSAPWLMRLNDAVDPVAYPPLTPPCRVWFAIPVTSDSGNDLLIVKFHGDVIPGDFPPDFEGYLSVKAVNAAGPRLVDFPGWERDVDMLLLEPGECGITYPSPPAGRYSLVVPVESFTGGDVYLIDGLTGVATWTFAYDSGSTAPLLGFEIGVDLLKMCGLAGFTPPNRLVIPSENGTGTDADLFIVDMVTGALLARAEDPALNPGLTLSGFEVGVDLKRWGGSGNFVLPLEGSSGPPGLVVMNPNGTATDQLFSTTLMGFRRSVDLVADASLFVPIGRDDELDTDVLRFPTYPTLSPSQSFEAFNPGLALKPFVNDVDLGLVGRTLPGEMYLFVPEERRSGLPGARTRFQVAPGSDLLAIPTGTSGGAEIRFANILTWMLTDSWVDLYGFEAGLDLANATGALRPRVDSEYTVFPQPTGLDGDSDPTLAWLTSPADANSSRERGLLRLTHRNPIEAPGLIRYVLPGPGAARIDILDVGGRRVRRFETGVEQPGEHILSWDGRDGRGERLPSGVYWIELRASGSGVARSKVVLVQ